MKAFKFLGILFLTTFFSQFLFAQTAKTETIAVNGNCGSCKKKIEKSALAAGATTAYWDKKTKFLNLSYDPAISNSQKIQRAIAEAGYDTRDFKASDSAYDKLEDCCQYDRKDLKEKKE